MHPWDTNISARALRLRWIATLDGMLHLGVVLPGRWRGIHLLSITIVFGRNMSAMNTTSNMVGAEYSRELPNGCSKMYRK